MILKYTQPDYMRGEEVRWVQERLQAYGYKPGKIDGVFGAKTDAAVKAFQEEHGIVSDGVVCACTHAILAEDPPAEKCDHVPDFIKWLRKQLGQIYVWGAQGEEVTCSEWIYSKETTAYNGARASVLYKKRVAEGKDPILAYDCSGLIVRYLLDHGLIPYDLSSRGLYAKCLVIYRGELEPGDLVFRHNGVRIYHVGVYVGDGRVIESKGRDDGVVERDINASGEKYWNRFGRLPFLRG